VGKIKDEDESMEFCVEGGDECPCPKGLPLAFSSDPKLFKCIGISSVINAELVVLFLTMKY
jgi:hypothetical protein